MEATAKLFDARVGQLLTLLENAITDHGPEAWELTAMAIRYNTFNEMVAGAVWALVLLVLFGLIIPTASNKARKVYVKDKGQDWDEIEVFWGVWVPRLSAIGISIIIGIHTWANFKSWAIIIEPKLYLVYKTLGMI